MSTTMTKRLFIILTSLMAFLAPCVVAQQQVAVEAKMDSSVMWMGQQTVVHLSLVQDNDKPVMFPIITDTLTAGVEVLDVTQPDTTVLQNNRIQIEQEVLVTAFDSGLYYIPPFEYILGADTFHTQSLSLKVVPVEVDTTAQPMDIKGVVAPPFVLWDYIPGWLWYVLLALVVIAAGIWAYYYWQKKRKPQEEIVPEKQEPPYERAMSALQALRDSKLWQQGQEKSYYIRLVDILREYIDSRFGISAMEMTSAQIIEALRQNGILREVNRYMSDILAMADFVKFAKMRPMPDDNERVMRQAIDFVELTKPQPEPESTPVDTPQTDEKENK